MARYVGAAVATALAATIYSTVTQDKLDAGKDAADALAAGLSRASILMAVISAFGVLMALLIGRHRQRPPEAGDTAIATAAHSHTLVPVRPDAKDATDPVGTSA